VTSEGKPDNQGYAGTDNLEVMADAKNYNAYLARLVTDRLPRAGTCLDFGAGLGTLAEVIQSTGAQVDAFEPDQRHRDAITARGIRAFSHLVEVPDGQYSSVYTFNVLEHIEDDTGALKDIHRVLTPGGWLLIYVPALPWLYTSMDRKVGHLRRYVLKELVAKVREAGFQINDARYVDSLGVIATLSYKAFGNQTGNLNTSAVKFYDTLLFPISLAVDRLMRRFIGKNALVVATKQGG
jgi:SAM-dependent methyltransferase